jgi:hypothetical protein
MNEQVHQHGINVLIVNEYSDDWSRYTSIYYNNIIVVIKPA